MLVSFRDKSFQQLVSIKIPSFDQSLNAKLRNDEIYNNDMVYCDVKYCIHDSKHEHLTLLAVSNFVDGRPTKFELNNPIYGYSYMKFSISSDYYLHYLVFAEKTVLYSISGLMRESKNDNTRNRSDECLISEEDLYTRKKGENLKNWAKDEKVKNVLKNLTIQD